MRHLLLALPILPLIHLLANRKFGELALNANQKKSFLLLQIRFLFTPSLLTFLTHA